MALMIALSATLSNAQDLSIGASLKSSTMGVGGDVVFQFHERMSVRAGYDWAGFSLNQDLTLEGIDFNAQAKLKTGSLLALYDFYIAKILFVSAGFGLNNLNINIAGQAKSNMPYGDIEIPVDKLGSFTFDLKPKLKVSPYLGIGFGRTLSKNKTVGFAFELGTFYQGPPKISIVSEGLISPTGNPDFGQAELLEKQLSQYVLYPVAKMSLSFKIHSF